MKAHSLMALVISALACIQTIHANETATKGAELGKWTQDYDAAVKLAAEKKVPLLLNFTGSDWCGWCKIMDKNVFAMPEWKEYAGANMVLVVLDFPQDKSLVPAEYVERNKKLQGEFNVSGYPTYMILDYDGKTLLGKLGAGKEKTPQSFINEVKETLIFSESAIAAKVKELGPEKGAAYKAAIGEVQDARKTLTTWIATRPPRNPENEKKFNEMRGALEAATEKVAKF
jgi:thioredoxin-related protein